MVVKQKKRESVFIIQGLYYNLNNTFIFIKSLLGILSSWKEEEKTSVFVHGNYVNKGPKKYRRRRRTKYKSRM